MLINILAILAFVVGIPTILWGIWNEEKLIAFEKSCLRRTKNEMQNSDAPTA